MQNLIYFANFYGHTHSISDGTDNLQISYLNAVCISKKIFRPKKSIMHSQSIMNSLDAGYVTAPARQEPNSV